MQVRVQSSKSVRQKKTFVFVLTSALLVIVLFDETFVFYRHIVYNVFRCVFLTLYQIEGNRKRV